MKQKVFFTTMGNKRPLFFNREKKTKRENFLEIMAEIIRG